MLIPLLDLKTQYQRIKPEINRAIQKVLEDQVFILGKQVQDFEEALQNYILCPTIGVSSGTDALLLTLMALDIHEGDEVITTPYSFFATAGCIARLKARPVFVDICPDTFNIDPEKIEQAITPKTKAIIPVHLFGHPADMTAIMDIAKRHNLKVIEDAAQAIGACHGAHAVGSIGDAGALSFFPSKNLGGYGDGGAVLTKDEQIFTAVMQLRVHGQSEQYTHERIGGNFRLDALQAAILSAKLPQLPSWNATRRKTAEEYSNAFKNLPVVTPITRCGDIHVFNQYVLRTNQRDALKKHLTACCIGTAVYYHRPLHLQPCFKYLGYTQGDLPIAETAAAESLALPIYPELCDTEKQYIINAVKTFFTKG